ncbi:chymotrypsin-C-like [Anopheles ziemanni]|uniref:chymotrypsin-C-like n=1 Tax=Anopheles coustani TaxID=139045 RepID=UPI0026585623|nr:chymotrypsin-C-like [Anopheles coustani]XP_058168788.1 chymotrypsin-C-like [Anopheles ziemanni]
MAKCVAFVLALLVVGGLGQTPTTLRDTVPGEFPSVVVITTPTPRRYCLGTVLNEYHVLTAAPCVLTNDNMRIFPPRLVHVIGGDLTIMPVGIHRQTRAVEHIFVHENYRPHTNENSFAVIRLAEPFDLPSNVIEEVEIQTRILPDGHPCDVVRWFRPGGTGEPTSVPRQQAFNVNIRNRDVCISRRPWELTIREDLLCMELSAAGFATTVGDLMFCDGRLAAILSFRWNSSQIPHIAATQPRFHSHWINQQLNRTQPMPEGWNPVEF